MTQPTRRKLWTLACLTAAFGWMSAQAAAPATPQGYIKAKEFLNIGGTAITDLTGNAKFPDRPDLVAYPTYFEWPQADPPDINTPPPGDVKNNYGVQIIGYFHPPATEAYTFYLSADDNAELWLSTDENPANRVRIATEPQWNNPRDYFGTDRRPNAENISAPINLVQGRAYYIEALMKEGTGGDNLSVSIDGFLPISGDMLSGFEVGQAPVILAQPADAFVYAGGSATFSVGFDIPPPGTLTSIRWQKNNADIPGSNVSTLTLPVVAADNGAKIKAILTTSVGTVTSEEATLTVASLANEFTPGVVKFEAYHDIAGTAVDLLLDDPKYPDAPDNVALLGAIDTPNGYGDNYGARVTGFFIPPTTGQYRFFIRSDDASRFYLNTTAGGATPDAFLDVPIAEETGCCGAFLEPDDDMGQPYETSLAIPLTGGQRYAFLALVKEGGGGDFLQVAVRREGDTTPAGSLVPLGGSMVGVNAKPSLGTPQITGQPQGIPQLLQGRSAVLSIAASVTPTAYNFPVLVQWHRNGTAIPGATGLSYSIASASAADSGTYTAVVSAPSGESVTSGEAVVTYVADTFAPRISRVQATSVSTLIVTFDEPIDVATAGMAGNYSISGGVTISAATASGSSVLLSTSALTVGADYTLTAGGVRDPYGNTMAAGTTANFRANVVSYADVILADGPILYYRFEEGTGQRTVNLGTAGSAADGLWMTGFGPDDSSPTDVSFGEGPRPSEFFGFAASNRSARFTGQDDLLWLDAQLQLLNNLGAFTLEYWVKPANRVSDPTTFGNRIGIVGQNDAVEYGFINPNTIQIWTPGGGSLDTTYTFPDNTWHHVATIADGTSIKNYFNGVFINQITQSSANYGSSDFSVRIGGGGVFDGSGNHFTGEIDEVAIFDKAIPADRVAAHFRAGKEGGSAPGSDPATLIVSRTATGVTLAWEGGGTLETAPAVTGPWTPVAGASSPHAVLSSGAAAYYRVSQ
ncbi:MAG: Ig-like domain-containing protein [Verrucomicrobiae bacterium]|nr:Ig-like domain-containing protein [Verrucomicrobiae bacterium]